ncbi:BlaI/MecI/CopY family transcriptional regulator [Rhizosphaericola mali]|uniref:BlaI/MecI/CopY family transcriptional regulator n=1 Tax=Rhizosphaericola mali TaxID=2545455 RepID=A0A5P2GCX9_9BACT|nr:BlaI/MecI/CopY family transcriptional regulator [Rhizosphaericola mali]QES89441.1 BlaI/MecI/CopY family transcriptional regulator [Rhizosphaericola mali]
MIELSKTEEQLMELIWKMEPVFMKEILEALPEPKPAPSTIATLLKRMQEKEFISFETFGNSRQYKSLVAKDKYFSTRVNGMIKDFFNNSALKFASFFTTNSKLSNSELAELRNMIDQQLKEQKDE